MDSRSLFDKSGNERLVRFEDDGTGLSQIEPSGDDAFEVSFKWLEARFDTKINGKQYRSDIDELVENPVDFSKFRLVTNGDTLTLSFETSERISLQDDESWFPETITVNDFNGLDELGFNESITLQSSDTDGTKWQAELLIDETLTSLQDEEGTLGFKVTVLDKVGNRRVIEFSDDGTYGDGFVSGLT